MNVGILALQGAVTPHAQMLETLGATVVRVTASEHLSQIERLILPGGESTTMLRLIDKTNLWEPLIAFGKTKSVWGTCAGAILVAKEVVHPSQRSFNLIEISAERNAYGSQIDSFNADIEIKGIKNPLVASFIRAPRLKPLSEKVEVLSVYNDDAILMRQNNILVSSFHSELGEDVSLHEFFLNMN